MIYKRSQFYYMPHKDAPRIWEPAIKSEVLKDKHRTLVPKDVIVFIGDVECTYSVADFILLEGFLCPVTQPENKS